jgi:1,4-dihydroxy-6-naphthoate synthase
LTYGARGLHKIVDVGAWWYDRMKLPLPLGANVIRRGLGVDIVARANRVLQRSIRWALDHRDEMIQFLLNDSNRPDEIATHDLLDRYLGMYANEDTYAYTDDVRDGIEAVMDLLRRHETYDRVPAVEFA